MGKRLLACGVLLAVGVSAALGADRPATGNKLSAAQIVERNVTARGGLPAWRAVQSMSMTGKLEAGGTKNVQLPFVLEMKRPRNTRLELQVNGQTAIQVYDGANGWKLRPFLNRHEVEPFSPDERKAAALQSELDGPLVDYAAKGTKVELEGTETVGSSDAYKLKLTLKNGDVRRVWVDTESFLDIKVDGPPRKLDGRMHSVATYLRDYRPVSGVMVPFVMETAVDGVQRTEKIKVEKVVVNPVIADSRFSKPQ